MKKKLVTLIAMLSIAALTACGSEDASDNTKKSTTGTTTESKSDTAAKADEESDALPYTVEIIYPDPSLESLTKEAFDDAVSRDQDPNGEYQNSSFPYVTITNTSDEAYSITYDDTIQSTRTDCYFEPGEVIFCKPHCVIDENGIYTWAGPEYISTGSANEKLDTIRGSITVNFADSFIEEWSFYNRMSMELPVIRNPHLEVLTLCHINYYDEDGNVVATDGCSNKPLNSSQNEGINLHFTPAINAPKSITWDHLEVFWMYTLPDNSAG